MEKGNKKSKKGFLIPESILLILIIISSIICVLLNNELNKAKKSYLKNKSDYKLALENLNIKKVELENITNELNGYKNIDETIESIKKEYFGEIKKLEDDILSGKSDRKIAYMTFDDGPYSNTYKVLNILDEKDVKATFFTISMNGEYCYDNKSVRCFDLYKEYVKRGHTIANHTYTHAIRYGLYNSVDSFMNAIDKQQEHVKNMTGGYTTNIVRFPGGSSTAKGLKGPIIEALRSKGYGWVDWTAQDGDGGGLYSEDQAWSLLKGSLDKNIEVILFHDYNTITTNILPDVINYLRENGYELYPLFYESNMINK